MRARVCVCVCFISVNVKRQVLPPCAVDGHYRNPLYYHYYYYKVLLGTGSPGQLERSDELVIGTRPSTPSPPLISRMWLLWTLSNIKKEGRFLPNSPSCPHFPVSHFLPLSPPLSLSLSLTHTHTHTHSLSLSLSLSLQAHKVRTGHALQTVWPESMLQCFPYLRGMKEVVDMGTGDRWTFSLQLTARGLTVT